MVDYDLGKVVGDKGETGNGIASITLHSTIGKVKTYRVTYTDGATFDFQVSDGSDASVTVDSSLSSTSTNPVQNKIINSALNGKANSSHTHSIANVTDLQTTLDGKASSSHNHNISDVNNLQSSLDGKANSSHTHTVSNITDFPSIVDNLNSTSSTSVLSARQGKVLNDLIDVKSDFSGSYADLTNVPSTFPPSSHTHTKSQITDFPTIPSKISDLTNDSDFIEKSATVGLVKNDGTIDTTAYLSQMKVGSSANYLIYTTSNGVLASKQKLGNINYLGRIGSTSGLPLKTGTNGVIETGSFGTSSGTFAEGNHTHSEYVNPVIVDNLTTDDATKVLSARQGKVLNDLIGTAIQYINQ